MKRHPRPGSSRFYRLGTTGILLAVGLSMTACGGTDGSDAGPTQAPSENSTGTTPEDASAAPESSATEPSSGSAAGRPDELPTGFDVDNETKFPEVNVIDVAMTEELAFSVTPEQVTARSLPGLEVAFEVAGETGFVSDLWLSEDGDDALVVETGLVAGEGTQVGTTSYTVSRLDLETGELTDPTTVDLPQDPEDSAEGRRATVVGVAGDVVVLDSIPTSAAGDPLSTASARHVSLGVDLGAGELAWSAAETRSLAVTADRVVTKVGTPQDGGPIRAVDAESGEELWSVRRNASTAALVGLGDETVSLTVQVGDTDRAEVVSLLLEDGSSAAPRQSSPSWNWSCQEPVDEVAVCNVVGSNATLGWDVAQNRPRWRLPSESRFAPVISTVADDYAYGVVLGASGVVLDVATGEDVGIDTGAAPQVVNVWGGLSSLEGQAVFQPAA